MQRLVGRQPAPFVIDCKGYMGSIYGLITDILGVYRRDLTLKSLRGRRGAGGFEAREVDLGIWGAKSFERSGAWEGL